MAAKRLFALQKYLDTEMWQTIRVYSKSSALYVDKSISRTLILGGSNVKRCGKIIRQFLTAALTLPLLCGCGGDTQNEIMMEYYPNAQSESKGTKLTFFGYNADSINLVTIESALHDFMKENPDIYITYEGIRAADYWNALELRDEADLLDDIIMIDHENVLKLSAEGKLADMSGLPAIKYYTEDVKKQFTEPDGSVYFLPTCIATYNLYVNTDLLKQHNKKVPENLAEFTDVCDYFVSQGVTPIIANNYYSLQSLITAKGMYPVYQSENPGAEIQKFNSGEADLAEQLRPGVELLADMTAHGWFDSEEVLATKQTSDDLEIFSRGERPFMITGGWAGTKLDVDFSYSVFPYPILDDGSVLSIKMGTCVSINAKSAHVEEAMKFMEFITHTDVIWSYCDSQNSYTPMKDSRIPSEPTIAPNISYLTNGRNVLGIDYNLDFPLDNILRECGHKIVQGMDADSAMTLLSSRIDSARGTNTGKGS